MKKILLIIACLMLVSSTVSAGGYMGIVDRTATRDTLTFQVAFLDSLGSPTVGAAGDSAYMVITGPGGEVCYRDSTLLAGLITYTKEDHPDTYGWAERVSVMDGSNTDEGVFSYSIYLRDIDLELTSYYTGSFQIINLGTLDGKLDSAAQAQLASTHSVDDIYAEDTISNNTAGSYGVMWKDDVFQQGAAGSLDMLDSLIYGGVVYVDGGSNTDVVIGEDGTVMNPVQDIATAKTIADILGIKTIMIVDGANETLAATMNDYHFIGVGSIDNVTMTLGGQDVDGSVFENMIITGEQGGVGLMGAVNAAFTAADSLEVHARNCAFVGDISVRGNSSSYFDACYSAVAGNGTPSLDFEASVDVTNVSVRHYSGGLEVKGMTSDHTISFESDGQIVINADCTSGNLSLRGNMTVTDNGTTSSITKDAVYSKQDILSWLASDTTTAGTFWAQLIWASDPTNWTDITDVVDTISAVLDSVRSQDDWVSKQASIVAYFDSLFTFDTYGGSDRWSFEVRGDDYDTLFFGSGATIETGDTLGYQVFFHEGGSSGDPPDSAKSYLWP